MQTTGERYTRFARDEAHGNTPLYEEWALGIAGDAELLALVDALPAQRREPNLVFAVARLLGAPEGGYTAFREHVVANWNAIAAEILLRYTQTNEARRCAALLPALAAIPGPLALLEIGASAGLCLYPDRYSYRYDGGARLDPDDGPSAVLLESTTSGGMPVPTRLPRVVWRAGIDLHPLDVRNAEDARWLETLVWPEPGERVQRLHAAIDIVRSSPPRIVEGDALDALASVAAEAPPDATLVIITSGTLVYMVRADRQRFAAQVEETGARWVSLEAAGLLEPVASQLTARTGLTQPELAGRFALSLDGTPLAFAHPHGARIDWLPPLDRHL
jgi:hypothetical protein